MSTDHLASNLRLAFDLYDAGERMQRQNLMRRHPGADETTIRALLAVWLRQRPGAEHGDADGRPIDPDGISQ